MTTRPPLRAVRRGLAPPSKPAGTAPPERSLRPLLGGVGVFVCLAVLATAGLKSYRDLEKARAHESELEAAIAAANGRLEVLARRGELLESDPQTLERLAREQLGMVRPGDVVIVLPDEESTPPPAATP